MNWQTLVYRQKRSRETMLNPDDLQKQAEECWVLSRQAQQTIQKSIEPFIPPPLAEDLDGCKLGINPRSRELLIQLKDDHGECKKNLILARQKLFSLATQLDLQKVTLLNERGKVATFPSNARTVNFSTQPMLTNFEQECEQRLERLQIESEIINCPHSATIIRLDGKLLYCNDAQTKRFTSLDFSEFLGLNARVVWTDEEWERRENYLNLDGHINAFEYKGYRLVERRSGIDKLHKFCGDFRKVRYAGYECILGIFRFA